MWHHLGHFHFSNSILCQFSAPTRFPYVQMIRCCSRRTISFVRFSNIWYTTCVHSLFCPFFSKLLLYIKKNYVSLVCSFNNLLLLSKDVLLLDYRRLDIYHCFKIVKYLQSLSSLFHLLIFICKLKVKVRRGT